jgi:predicted ATPase
MAEAIEVGTMRRPLILLLEDLHWSDSATIEFLAYLAKRRQPMRFLVVATYRPVDVVMGAHSVKTVKQELQAHGLCEEVRLELLKKQEIEEYVAGRFPESEVATALAPEVYRRTDGNPLFMVNVVEHCINQGLVVYEQGRWALKGNVGELLIPENLRQLIAQQVERLSEEQRQVLEGASVAGAEFTVAAVAAALKQEMDEVETVCEEVAGQGHFLEERGIAEWPDGTISGRYAFRHALYQNVLSDRIAEARRIRLHRLIGERLEQGYRERAQEFAAELAVHFERSHDTQRAIQYRQHAGQNAIRRSAHQEAIGHLTRGLALLKTVPDIPERIQQELTLQNTLGVSLRAIKGYADPEVERTYKRALELCQQMGETPQLFPALYGLFGFYIVGAKHKTSHELAEQLLSIAQRQQDPALLLEAHRALGQSSLHRGEFVRAYSHFEEGVTLYDPRQHGSHVFAYAGDPRIVCLDSASIALWQLGYPDQAVQKSHEAIVLAQEISHPFSLAHALWFAAMLHQHRQDRQAALAQAETLIALCNEQGFAFWLVGGIIFQGWALAGQGQREEGIAQIRQGIVDWRATGAGRFRHYFLALLAEVCGQTDRAEEGLALLAEAVTVAQQDGDSLYEPELYRLKGTLTLQQASQKSKVKGQKSKVPNLKSQLLNPNSHAEAEAEAYFLKAIEIARHQQAKSLELRATMSLARLWQQQGKQKEGHQVLAEIYGWFTEGLDTKDLQEAKALIEELSH